MFYLASFLVLLGPLVFVHEFGHFIFAKLFNVRVDVFSMGFGPKFIKKRWGETEYALSVIPLGGYVKLYGQDPTEPVDSHMRSRALRNLDAWKRFLIFFAGPLFNFLFAIVVFALILVIGEPHVAPVVARVVPGSQAAEAGFRAGDVITAVGRQVVTKYEEVTKAINDSPNKRMTFRVKRNSQLKQITAEPKVTAGTSLYGEPIEVGEIEGLLSEGRYTTIGVSNPESIAGRAGLKTGDEIVTFNGAAVKSWEALIDSVRAALNAHATKFRLGIVHHDLAYWSPEGHPMPASKAETELTLPARQLESMGMHSSELFVSALKDGSPAQQSGIEPGDRIESIDGNSISYFQGLKDLVQHAGESTGQFELKLERTGKPVAMKIVPAVEVGHDPAGNETKQYLMGIYPLFVQAEPEMFVERIFNPFALTIEAWSRALDLSAKTLISIKKLFFNQVSVRTLGGPILIGKLAGDSMMHGVSPFLKVMALISISLAIFNILPVPILDGGHIFLLLVEVIRGRPISMRQTEFVQQLGLSLIVFLLVVVLYNDLSRVALPGLKQFFQ